jgi:hypothetical protein
MRGAGGANVMCTRRVIACAVLAGMLASAPIPVTAKEVDFGAHKAAESGVDAVGIGLGVTAGVLALIGGTVWYLVHRHHEDTDEANPGAKAPPVPQS